MGLNFVKFRPVTAVCAIIGEVLVVYERFARKICTFVEYYKAKIPLSKLKKIAYGYFEEILR